MLRKTMLPPAVREKLQFLLESQYWSCDQLKQYQWRKLQALLRHSCAHVPYYRQLFDCHAIRVDQIQSFNDFRQIPPLSKQLIRDNFSQLRADSSPVEGLYLEHTGGSTGEPLKCYQDHDYLTWAAAARIRAWKYFPGFDEHTREALLWGADQDVANTLTPGQMIATIFSHRDIQLNTFNATESRFRRFAFLCNMLKPQIVRGYASSLTFFCEYLRKQGLQVHPPASIISSAEVLTPKNRAGIEDMLHAKVLDSYGCRETSLNAMECRQQNGLHVAMENNYLEVDEGRIVVTNLNNFAMPLVRYEIGDRAEAFLAGQCACGRGLERIARIEGRTSDTLRFGDRIVHAEYITHLFYTDTPVTRFQVIKNEQQNRLTLLVDKQDGRLEQAVRQSLEHKFPGTTIVVRVTQDFIKTSTGKTRLVVDEADL